VPFNTGMAYNIYGMDLITFTPTNWYCQSNTSASDYGKCYNTSAGEKARFVQTDTTTWPIDPTTGDSFPCAKDGTCIRYTSTAFNRTLATVFSYPNKQAIVYRMVLRSHTSLPGISDPSPVKLLGVAVYNAVQDYQYTFVSGVHTYESITYPYYDPVFNYKIYYKPYSIPAGSVVVIRWLGNVFTSILYFGAYENGQNNIWYAAIGQVYWFYESSPISVIPLNYEKDYIMYQELRGAFGFSINGVDQPGWNADDMIRVLRELFPNRAWAVFDDRQYTLYLYNLTPDYVPDWLIDKLSPTAMKVLKAPSDASVAKYWLDELNRRNGYNQTPVETV